MGLKMGSCLRLRLEFNNSDILTDTQRSLGLDKSWLLVNTNFTTIAALSAHILYKFQLNQTCPNGLLLSMDGFALPPFVSIGILKDKDVISVQKIDHLTVEGSDASDKDDEEQQLVAINCVGTGALLLSNEEFDEENGGHESEEPDDESAEEDENDASKKRKASQKLKSPKKKKQRSEPCETVATGIHKESEYIESPHEDEVPSGKKRKSKKGKSSKTKNQTTGGDNTSLKGKTKKDVESASNLKKKEQFQENDEDVDGASNASGRTGKGPSRSSLRQYAKRTMLREMKKVWDKNGDSLSKEVKKKKRHNKAEKGAGPDQLQNEDTNQPKGLLHLMQFGGRDGSKVCSKPEEENQNHKSHGNSNKDNDTSNDLVPTEIRPGLFRFEALEEDQQVQQSRASLVDEDSSLVDVHSVKNNNLGPSASRETKLADGGHICNENGATSMPLSSNEKCTDFMLNSNGGTNQGNSAQAPSTPEKGVDLWEQLTKALSSKKEELSKESSWGKITPSKHTLSYEAFGSGAVRPTTSYRGRGRNYPTTSFRGGRGRGRNNPTTSYRGRGRDHG